MLKRLIGESVELELRLGGGLPPVLADAHQLEQVIMNLVINARDAMPKGGKITLETAPALLKAEDLAGSPGAAPGPHVMLTVKDNGHGMDEAVMARIFEPFFSTKPQGLGSGLGLSTVYGIVTQGQGHLSVESEPERGSSFHVYLPLAPEGAQAKAPSKPQGPPGLRGTETVLVVEDDDSLRYLARVLLMRFGYEVMDDPSAEAALRRVERNPEPFDLLLCDMGLPGMGGRELGARMRQLRPAIRVLFMTGYLHPDAAAEMEQGKLDCITKPFSAESLGLKIREILQRPKA